MKAAYTSEAFSTAAGVAVGANAAIEVRREDTNAIATIWSDEAGTVALANPFNADASGRFVFYTTGLRRGYSVKATFNAEVYTARNQAIGIAGQLDASAIGEAVMNAADAPAAVSVLGAARRLFSYIGADVPTTGDPEETLLTYALPANTLDADGKIIRVRAWGVGANNANAKIVWVYFGTNAFGMNLIAGSANQWRGELVVVRKGIGAQKASYDNLIAAATASVGTTSNDLAQNEAAGITIKVTGDGVAAGDITAKGMTVELLN